MKRIVNIAKNKQEADQWDIKQALQMSHEERQAIAAILKKRVYGEDNPDIKVSRKMNKGV
ncbi:MAG: hypothetical protein U5J95_12875 [Balneolaceae bacterium]|nr:hypothetical protein [Balneolaceae bacterium]